MRRLAAVLLFAMAEVYAQLPTREGLPTLAPILEKVTPAVVNIAVLQKSPEEENPLMRDPFFRRFFGGPQQSEPQGAAGSGAVGRAEDRAASRKRPRAQDAQQSRATPRPTRP